MPKTYSEGHKAREITLAEAAIVKLREAKELAGNRASVEHDKADLLKLRAAEIQSKAIAKLKAGDWDRKIDAAEAHLAWLRAMPVPDELPANSTPEAAEK